MAITYTHSPDCDLGLSKNPSGGPPQFWLRSKCAKENTLFHLTEFPTTTAGGLMGKRGDIWGLKKGEQKDQVLRPDTRLVVVYMNGNEILHCLVDLQKAKLLSVIPPPPEQGEATEEYTTIPTTVEAATPIVEGGSPLATTEVVATPATQKKPRQTRTPRMKAATVGHPAAKTPAKTPRKRVTKPKEEPAVAGST